MQSLKRRNVLEAHQTPEKRRAQRARERVNIEVAIDCLEKARKHVVEASAEIGMVSLDSFDDLTKPARIALDTLISQLTELEDGG